MTTSVSSTSALSNAGTSSATSAKDGDGSCLWDWDAAKLDSWWWPLVPTDLTANENSQLYWKNLHKALAACNVETVEVKNGNTDENGNKDDGEDDNNSPPKKRRKRAKTRLVLHDPYNLFLRNKAISEDPDAPLPDVPDTEGGKLSQLTVGGIVNALGGIIDGLVEATATPSQTAVTRLAQPHHLDATILHQLATLCHSKVQTRLHRDILITTPIRIRTLLAPDLTAAEFANVRKRIRDTVILGKSTHANVVEEDDTVAVASKAPTGAGAADKYQKCPSCGNNDQSAFVMDRKNGDIICSNCGTVVSESLMHEGSQYRKFEGEVDRNHHGDAPNPLYSNAHNMSTTLGGMSANVGAGIGGWGSTGKKNLETILRNAHAYTELNISQFGKTDRRTRVGYKDRQKKDAFIQMSHVGDALNLHEAVIQRAKEFFAGFRDDRELIQQFKPVIAACLCEAFEQLSQQGQAILKDQQTIDAAPTKDDDNVDEKAGSNNNSYNNSNGVDSKISARAARRNELHHATLAGKGGLLLNFEGLQKEKEISSIPGPEAEKPAATWDLDDCRSWLLEASRTIAQQWVEERDRDPVAAKRLPTESLAELEGRLVEHAITLSEYLENEMQNHNAPNRRSITPRVKDMSKLGIKWQHIYERGSGGNGGIGNNGGTKNNGGAGALNASGTTNGRKAGQILILKTAKKLGQVLNDPLAGEAIHKELRNVVSRQEARKSMMQREEASRQRMQQMKRKPWLQAKLSQA